MNKPFKYFVATLTFLITFVAVGQWYDFIGQLQMDPNSPNAPYSAGMVFYDNGEHSLSYYNDEADVTVNIAQEHLVRVRNVTGVTITDGAAVYVSGSTGTTPQITLAQADFIEAAFIVGVATHDIENNSFGYVTTQGIVNGIDLSGFADGDTVFVSPTVAGEFVVAPPTLPNLLVKVGTVLRAHATQGRLLVDVDQITRADYVHRNLLGNLTGDANFVQDVAIYGTGNNATFENGGVLSGTFATSVVAADQLEGTRVFKYTQAAGSLNDWVSTPIFDIPEIVNTTSISIGYEFRYKYDGDDDDIEVRAICVDDSTILLDSTTVGVGLDKDIYKASGEVLVPKDCNQVQIGFQVAVLNNGAILLWDEIKISADPFIFKNLVDTQTIRVHTSNGHGSTNTRIRRFSTIESSVGPNLVTFTQSATLGDSFVLNKNATCTFSYADNFNAGSFNGLSLNSTELSTAITAITVEDRLGANATTGSNNAGSLSWSGDLVTGDIVRPHTNGQPDGVANRTTMTATCFAQAEHVVTPATNTATDWAVFTPTFGGMTTSSSNLLWRRAGSNLEIRGFFTATTVAAAAAYIELPLGLEHGVANNGEVGGMWWGVPTSTRAIEDNSVQGWMFTPNSETDKNRLHFAQNVGSSVFNTVNGSAMIIAGQTISLQISVPIQGWTSAGTFMAAIPLVRYETKVLTSTVTTDTTITDLGFSNLTVGKYYRLSGQMMAFRTAAGNDNVRIDFENNSSTIVIPEISLSGNNTQMRQGFTTVFKAAATTVTASSESVAASTTISGNSTQEQTFVTLEELNFHTETTGF